jgi:hypothetical protein
MSMSFGERAFRRTAAGGRVIAGQPRSPTFVAKAAIPITYPEVKLCIGGDWRSRGGEPVFNPYDNSQVRPVLHRALDALRTDRGGRTGYHTRQCRGNGPNLHGRGHPASPQHRGQSGGLMGVPRDWALHVIQAVGNYGEVYDRHFSPNTPSSLPRGPNNVSSKGGLHYSPPFR